MNIDARYTVCRISYIYIVRGMRLVKLYVRLIWFLPVPPYPSRCVPKFKLRITWPKCPLRCRFSIKITAGEQEKGGRASFFQFFHIFNKTPPFLTLPPQLMQGQMSPTLLLPPTPPFQRGIFAGWVWFHSCWISRWHLAWAWGSSSLQSD